MSDPMEPDTAYILDKRETGKRCKNCIVEMSDV